MSLHPEQLFMAPHGLGESLQGVMSCAVFAALPLGAALLDPTGRVISVNRAFTAITGFRLVPAAEGGQCFESTVPHACPEAAADFEAQLRQLVAQRDPTASVLCADGCVRQLALQHAPVGGGCSVLTLADVSEAAAAMRTTRALYDIANAISVTRDLPELYAAIHAILHRHVDATNFFIGVVDEEADCIVFPYFADEVDDYYDIPNISDPATDTLTVRVIRTGKPLFLRNRELMARKARGEIGVVGTDPAVWLGVPLTVGGKVIGAMAVQHYANPLHYDATDVAFMVAVSEQVAVAIERKKAEEELSRLNEQLEAMVAERTAELELQARELTLANERLQELDRVKSALLSSVSHELRTPLTSIMGFAKLIRKDFQKHFQQAPLGAEVLRRGARILTNLEIVTRESERLTRLISEFLDLARIESGHMFWNDEPVDPAQAVREAAQAVQGLFRNTNPVVLRLEVHEPLPRLRLDPDRLRQVLLNLLSNAAKFTPAGEVVLSVQAVEGGVAFSVRDTGLGIPPQALERVFEKFFKVEEHLRGCIPGTGLGLAICKQIVEHYRGRIGVTSAPGRGSTFTVLLPVAC